MIVFCCSLCLYLPSSSACAVVQVFDILEHMSYLSRLFLSLIYLSLSPVPSYKWFRRNGNLPRGSQLTNYNRVLTLPSVEPGDVGEYVCQARNEKITIQASIALSIQGECLQTLLCFANVVLYIVCCDTAAEG